MSPLMISESMDLVQDIIHNRKDDNGVLCTLLFDRDFVATVRARVPIWEPTIDLRLSPCICNRQRTRSLRYQHSNTHQSKYEMAPRSLPCLGPNYQRELEASQTYPSYL